MDNSPNNTQTRRFLSRHDEQGFGLSYPVRLLHSAVEHGYSDGRVLGVSIPDMEFLALVVAAERVSLMVEFDGSEIRFLRKVWKLSLEDFAAALNIGESYLDYWERTGLPPACCADQLVRVATASMLRSRLHDHNIDSLLDPADRLFMRPTKSHREHGHLVFEHFSHNVVFSHGSNRWYPIYNIKDI